ncbi:MAG: hypothetical protein AB201_00100 [Parcubacteria bacterium C7867-006]|nr:MAG: hypothetical protein AB201_00100 [Parcubacteria bacterium C7867-006]
MKKYFPYILILVVMVGLLIPTHIATAGWWETVTGSDSILKIILQSLVEGILSLMGWILWLSGTLLNAVMKFTIVDLSTRLEGLTGINIAWKIIRDLMNIVFIFVLVYEGIKLILNMGSLNSVKNFIFGVVLASLLINFSLFFTRVLIDGSNVITIGIYNSIVTPPAVPNGFVGPIQDNYGLSDKIMSALGLQGIYGDTDLSANFGGGKGVGGILIMGLGSGIIILISSFVFFAVSIMFIIRYLTIIFLLMLSPVAYMGMALPEMKPYAKQWWDSLKGQLLFPPIFMVMMLVILTLMTSPGFITESYFSTLFNSGNSAPSFDTMNLLINFIVIIGLLITALVTAKTWASMGSKHIGNATKSLTAFTGGAIFGGAARVGRNTLGRFGNSVANNQDLLDRAAKGDRMARIQLAAANKAATSTFDTRGSRAFGKIADTAGMGKDFGKADDPKKQNFRKIREEQIKKDVDDAKKYKPNDLVVEEAKAKLNSQEFKDAEDARKREHDAYINSAEYKESPEAKKLEKDKSDNAEDKAKLKELRDKEEKMKAEIENARRVADLQRNDFEKSSKLKAKIIEDEEKLARQQDVSRKLEENIKSRESDISQYEFEKGNYMSDEKRKLIERAGGQKVKKDKQGKPKADEDGKYRDEFGNVVELDKLIKGAYAQRISDRATREEAGPMWRWSANIVGTPLSAVIPMKPKTKADRSETARQIRKLAEEKSAKDKLAEAAKQMVEESATTEEPVVTPPANPPQGTTPPEGAPPAAPAT